MWLTGLSPRKKSRFSRPKVGNGIRVRSSMFHIFQKYLHNFADFGHIEIGKKFDLFGTYVAYQIARRFRRAAACKNLQLNAPSELASSQRLLTGATIQPQLKRVVYSSNPLKIDKDVLASPLFYIRLVIKYLLFARSGVEKYKSKGGHMNFDQQAGTQSQSLSQLYVAPPRPT